MLCSGFVPFFTIQKPTVVYFVGFLDFFPFIFSFLYVYLYV